MLGSEISSRKERGYIAVRAGRPSGGGLKRLPRVMARRRKKYLKSQKKGLLVEDATRNFFRNVKAFRAKERPKAFDVRELFPGKNDADVVTELAGFFNRISCEFSPLEPSEIPCTHDRELLVLRPFQVAS